MWNHFDIVRPLNKSAKKGKFHQNLCPSFFGLFFLSGRIHFVNTITPNKALASQLYSISEILYGIVLGAVLCYAVLIIVYLKYYCPYESLASLKTVSKLVF